MPLRLAGKPAAQDKPPLRGRLKRIEGAACFDTALRWRSAPTQHKRVWELGFVGLKPPVCAVFQASSAPSAASTATNDR
jgi:hypothetical protein